MSRREPPGAVVVERANATHQNTVIPGGSRPMPAAQVATVPPIRKEIPHGGQGSSAVLKPAASVPPVPDLTAVQAGSTNCTAQSEGRAPLLAGAHTNLNPGLQKFIRTTRVPRNIALAVALSAGPSSRPDAPLPDVRLPVATCPPSLKHDGRSSVGAPCRIGPTPSDTRHLVTAPHKPPTTIPNNLQSSSNQRTYPPYHPRIVRHPLVRPPPPVYRNAPNLAPPGYYPGPLDPRFELQNINATNQAHLPIANYYRYYQVLETPSTTRLLGNFLVKNNIPHEIAVYPVQYPTVREALAELEDLKEKMRANLYQERIYRDTEIKCLRGLIEICVQQAKDIEAQSNSLTGLAHINFMNNNQGFLQFIKEVKDRVEQCFANVKTELTIPVGLKAPIKPVVPRKQAPIIRQVQLQKSRPEDGVSAEELMRQSELASAQAEAARRKAMMEKEQSSCEMPKYYPLPGPALPPSEPIRSRRKPLKPAHIPVVNTVRPQNNQCITLLSDVQKKNLLQPPSGFRGPRFTLIDKLEATIKKEEPAITIKPESADTNEDPLVNGRDEPDDMEIFVDIEDDHESGAIFPLARRPSSQAKATPSPCASVPMVAPRGSSKDVQAPELSGMVVQNKQHSKVGARNGGELAIPERVILALQLGISFLKYSDFEWLRRVTDVTLKKGLKSLYDQIDWKEYVRLHRIVERHVLSGKVFTEQRLNTFFDPEILRMKRRAADQPPPVNNTHHPSDTYSEPQTCSSSEVSLSNQWQESGPPSHTGSTPSPLGTSAVPMSIQSISRISKMAETALRIKFNQALHQVKGETVGDAFNGHQPTTSFKPNAFPNTMQDELVGEFTGGKVMCQMCHRMTTICDLKDLIRHASLHVEKMKGMIRANVQVRYDESKINNWRPFVRQCFPEIAGKIFRQATKKTLLDPAVLNERGELTQDQLDHPYPCQECGEILNIQQGGDVETVCEPLIAHLIEKHRDICTPHKCEECNYINIHQWVVRLHISIRHTDKALSLNPVKDTDVENVSLFVREMFTGIETILGEKVDEEEEDITEGIGNIQRNGLTEEGLQKPPGGERRSEIPKPKPEPEVSTTVVLEESTADVVPAPPPEIPVNEENIIGCEMCNKAFDIIRGHALDILQKHAKSHFRIKQYECSCGDYGNSWIGCVNKHVLEKGDGHELQVHNNSFMHYHWRQMMNACFPKLKSIAPEFALGEVTVSNEESAKILLKRTGIALSATHRRYSAKRPAPETETPPSKKATPEVVEPKTSPSKAAEPEPSRPRRYPTRRTNQTTEVKEEPLDVE